MEGGPPCSDSVWGSFTRHSLYSYYLQTCSLPEVVRQLLGWVMYTDRLEIYLATLTKNTVEERRLWVTLISFRIDKFVLVLIFILVQIQCLSLIYTYIYSMKLTFKMDPTQLWCKRSLVPVTQWDLSIQSPHPIIKVKHGY